MSDISCLPGPFPFAFALVLIRSKPKGIAIKDYILALRRSSSLDSNSSVSDSVLVNHGKLWQELFFLSQQSNLYLRGTIASLSSERRQHSKEVKPNKKLVGRKRKLQCGSSESSQINDWSKRQRKSPSFEEVTEAHHNHEEEQHNDRTLILRVVFQLNRMMREPALDSVDIVSAITTACDAILQIIKNAQNSTVADKSSRSQVLTLNEACQAATRVWSAVVSTLEVRKDDPCAKLELVPLAIPISSIVHSFLCQLRQQCLNEADRRRKALSITGSAKGTDAKRCSGDALNETELFEYNTKVLTHSLIHLMSTAAKLHARQQDIFDAIASIFLQHIGESMGLHLFGYSGNGYATANAVPIPGISEALRTGVARARSAAQIEAPHLVEVLRPFVQTLVPGRLGCTGSKVIEKLQKTLMQGVFGSDDERGPSPTHSVVQDDPNTAETTDLGPAHSEDSKDWFLTQVWELLGWDVLIG